MLFIQVNLQLCIYSDRLYKSFASYCEFFLCKNELRFLQVLAFQKKQNKILQAGGFRRGWAGMKILLFIYCSLIIAQNHFRMIQMTKVS